MAVSKDDTPEKSPICTLNYLREVLGDGDSVWESAEKVLKEGLHLCQHLTLSVYKSFKLFNCRR